MAKFDGILICTDFDGTFALPDAVISRENCDAVKRFQDNGGKFTFASGRSPEFFDQFSQFRANAPIIAANGTMICNPDTYEKITTFPLTAEMWFTDLLDEISLMEQSEMMYLCDNRGQGIEWTKDSGVAPSVFFGKYSRPWYKLLLHQSIQNTFFMRDYVLSKYSDRLEVDRSYPMGVELHMKGSGKGECLKLIKSMDESIHTTIGVGDYDNDISLIKLADRGYAVGNAEPDVLAIADFITAKNTEHAIARIIAELDAELS